MSKEITKLVGTNIVVYDSVGASFIKKLREQKGKLNVEHQGQRVAIRQIGHEVIVDELCKITTERPIFLMIGEFDFVPPLA